VAVSDRKGERGNVPRSFRRESRWFLWIALLLILFLNFLTLLFFRDAVAWGNQEVERRADSILRQVALSTARVDGGEVATQIGVLEPDVLWLAIYNSRGHRTQVFGRVSSDAPLLLPSTRPSPGQIAHEWTPEDSVRATLDAGERFFVLTMDPGAGHALRDYARKLSLFVPLAAAALVVLAGFYLRSLLAPYERLLEAAGDAPANFDEPHGDERDFLIARFESSIAALREKEKELERMARREKERADDLETAARTLSRNLPTGLLSVDPDGRVVELNEAGREILRLERDFHGETFGEVLSEAPGFRVLLGEVLEQRVVAGRREVHWSRPPEPERIIGVTATPAQGADGRFLGAVALFSDLTEIRRLEGRVALVRHLADLGQVSAGAAHEFRNAAAAIDGFADLALRSTDPARGAEYVRAIRQEAQEMSRVTSDFLLFAKPEGFVPEPVDLGAVAEAAASETERSYPGVAVNRSGDLSAEVSGSALLLRRAIVNLLRNAVEATPAPRRGAPDAIAIWGGRGPKEVKLSVGDRGAGVAPAEREKIFLPFFSSKPGGSGFGLAIVARIAELHGGTVDVTEREGGGAVFTLRLPGK
jgi:signal transduction histidine kinase